MAFMLYLLEDTQQDLKGDGKKCDQIITVETVNVYFILFFFFKTGAAVRVDSVLLS